MAVDKDTIVQGILGLVITGVGGAVAFLFTSINSLKHDVDTLNTKMDQVQSEQRDIWDKYNDNQAEGIKHLREFYDAQREEDQRWIDYWKDKAHAKEQ